MGVVFYKILYNLYSWEKTENILVLIDRMKKPIGFPPHIKVSPWLKDLMEMMKIDEFKRLSIKKVLEILQVQSSKMDLE